MINSLQIENYAIIENIHIQFDESLNIITGETGAGKSIMMGALGLLMGKRIESKVFFQEQKKCIIEAQFSKPDATIETILEANDLDLDDLLIIRREILPSGKSRAFVNDTPTTLKVLQELSLHLVDLNQQFDLLDIQDTAFHLRMLDASAKNQEALIQFGVKYKEYKSKKQRLEELKGITAIALKEREFLKFQFEELDAAALESGEKNQIETDLSRLNNTEELRLLSQETQYTLKENEVNIYDQISTLTNKWNKLDLNDKDVEELKSALNLIMDSIDQIQHHSYQITDGLNADPETLEQLNERINLIFTLEKKHNVKSEEELLSIYQELGEKLDRYSSNDSEIKEIETAILKLEKELEKEALKLRKKRMSHAPALEKLINSKLTHLAMSNAKIKLEIGERTALNAYGLDDVEILFAPNKGSTFMPIKKVASGGEISRLMLCMKSSVAGVLKMPSLIFDEIDSGVSGEVALKMGTLLAELGSDHQVIVITHSPQVASKAKKHFHIYKEDSGSKTTTQMRILDTEQRTVEIAKMLSGDPPSNSAISNAKELIELKA